MYKAIAANKRNTVLIMAVFVALIGAIGWLVSWYYGNTNVAYVIIGVAAIYAWLQYYMATKIAISMTGAKEIQKRDNPRLYRIIENLAITLGMPTPKVYVIDDKAPNAFATGRDPKHAIVGVTTGLMDIMEDMELEAVMAHEMGHVKNYDIRVSMIAFGLVSVIGLLADIFLRMMIFGGGGNRGNNSSPVLLVVGLVVIIIAPILAAIVQMAVSRQREYLADVSGAMTTRNPDSLASALQKLKDNSQPLKHQHSATSHLFFSNPLKKGGFSKLFSTHPPLEDRIARLRKNADKF
jgi:heat shock protein HtpX